MAQHTFEGTWEELASQGEKLSGKRVRLTVLADCSPAAAVDAPFHETATHGGMVPGAVRVGRESPANRRRALR